MTAFDEKFDRTRYHLYEKMVCGHGAAQTGTANLVQVLGLGTGKGDNGVPAVASMQKSTSASGDWSPSYIKLTGATAPAVLDNLVVCAGYNATEAVGLGSDGNIYLVGTQTQSPAWVAGAGLLTQSTTFATSSLSACLINTVTVFAVSQAGAPWVAAYKNQASEDAWTAGYSLPTPTTLNLQSLLARPDTSGAGTIHAIGLTTTGQACEVATASGPGTGRGNWTAGKGTLGSTSTLPTLTQLLLVSGDSVGTFHVIGLGSDGSVWDVDQYSTTSSAWSGTSTNIVAAGTVSGSKIEFYVDGNMAINLVAWMTSSLTVFARFTSSWGTASAVIPTPGVSSRWQLITNLAASSAPDGTLSVLAVGLNGPGAVYELASYSNEAWTVGSSTPISK